MHCVIRVSGVSGMCTKCGVLEKFVMQLLQHNNVEQMSREMQDNRVINEIVHMPSSKQVVHDESTQSMFHVMSLVWTYG